MVTSMKHPFNEERCSYRLLWEYQKYDRLIIGIDFDNTIKLVKQDSSCEEVIELLRRCSNLPKFCLCLWSICPDGLEEITKKVEYCKSLGIRIDYINDSPFIINKSNNRKPYFNILLDDRAGLESAYNNLKYVVDYADNQSNIS